MKHLQVADVEARAPVCPGVRALLSQQVSLPFWGYCSIITSVGMLNFYQCVHPESQVLLQPGWKTQFPLGPRSCIQNPGRVNKVKLNV